MPGSFRSMMVPAMLEQFGHVAAVTVLYAISAFAINRVMSFIEKRARVPGFVVAGGMGGH